MTQTTKILEKLPQLRRLEIWSSAKVTPLESLNKLKNQQIVLDDAVGCGSRVRTVVFPLIKVRWRRIDEGGWRAYNDRYDNPKH